MGNCLKEGLSLSGSKLWLNAPCPIVFYARASLFDKEDAPAHKIRQILTEQTSILEISNIYHSTDGTTRFNILADRYVVEVYFNIGNRNFGIGTIYRAGERAKRSFIENDVKLINTSEHGIIFVRVTDGMDNREFTPENRCEDMKTKYKSNSNFKMRFEDYHVIKDYLVSETESDDGDFVFDYPYFDEKYLKTMEQYAAIDQAEEDEKASMTVPVTYSSRKSVKKAGDKRNKYKYEFECSDFDVSVYTSGSEVNVELEDGEHFERGKIVEIGEVEEGKRTMTVSFNNQFNDSDIPMSGLLHKAAGSCQKRVRDVVVEGFRTGKTKALYMLDAFNNPEKIETEPFDKSIDTAPIIDEIREKRAPYLNDMQQKAIEAGIQSKDITLVLGPPGTGKTTIIVEWALYFMRQRKRVLISSKNNKAVDNAFDRIARYINEYPEFKNLVIARVGNAEKVQSNVVEFMLDNQHKKMQEKILENNNIRIRELEQTVELIKNIAADFKNDNKKTEAFFALAAKMKDYYNRITLLLKKLVEFENKISEEHENVKKQLEDLDNLREEIESKNIYLEENKKLGFFGRVFRIIETHIILFERFKLNYKIKNFQLSDNSGEYVRRYNTAVGEIDAVISSPAFVSLKTQYRELCEYFETKGKLVVKDPLSDNVFTYSYAPSKEALEKFLLSLLDLEKKCVRVKNILGDWEKNVSDKDNEVLTNLLTKHVSVVGATCIGINSNYSVANLDFDVAIIDEAGQIQIHDLFVPMSRAPKTLMLGDHKQIPPSVSDTFLEKCDRAFVDTELARKSFFEYLFEQKAFPSANKVLLNMQFRMPEEVANIISKWFYNNRYDTSENKKKGVMPLIFPDVFDSPLVVIDTSDAPKEIRRETTEYDRKSNKKNRYNAYEAKIAVEVLRKIGFMSPDTELGIDKIGVVTALKRQKEELQSAVKREFPGLSSRQIETMVATVDSFQGQEREVIIYSCTRSNDRNEIGFLSELRRLNVALSRCKSQIVLIGDFEFLTTCVDSKDDEDDDVSVNESYEDTANVDLVYEDEALQDADDESYLEDIDFGLPDGDENVEEFYDESEDLEEDFERDYEDYYPDYDEEMIYDEEELSGEYLLEAEDLIPAPAFGFPDDDDDETKVSDAVIFGFGDEEEEKNSDESNDVDVDGFKSPELDSTVRSFSRFMSFLLDEVKAGNGQYIKSKEFGDKDE